MENLQVRYAVYGALAGGNPDASQAVDVTGSLQDHINRRQGVVTINNQNMGGDPSVGNVKHFGACVLVNGQPKFFACQEGQTIDFNHSKAPDTQLVAKGQVRTGR